MSENEKRILEMLEEMNQIADLANCLKKLSEEIDSTVYEANLKTIEMTKLRQTPGIELDFSDAMEFVKNSSVEVTSKLNCLIKEMSGLSHINITKEI